MNLAVGMVISDLLINGYAYAPLISEHLPFDVMGVEQWGDCKVRKIQVKYSSLDKKGAIHVNLRSSWADRHGTHINRVDRNTFDAYAVYCHEVKKVYYINVSKIPENLVNIFSLRVNRPKNNQRKGINFAKDFLGVDRIFE